MNEACIAEASSAARCIRCGGVIVYPTETVYGIGCDPWNHAAVERVLAMKRRLRTAMLLLADSRRMVEDRFGALDSLSALLADAFWPGPLTLVIRHPNVCSAHVGDPGQSSVECPNYLIGPTGGVAVRVTAHPLCAEIIREFGGPIVSTSANLSGEPPVAAFKDACELFGGEADMILESREPVTGTPSTIVDTMSGTVRCLREGALPLARILEVAQR
jgi:L-threonylcarbamoyladenylate synthase